MARPSLAERLGYGPEDRSLIVNCDDLGSSHSANVASLRSVIDGITTSATHLYEINLDLAEEFRVPVRMFSRECTTEQGFQARERAEARGVLFNEHLVWPWPRRTRDVFFEEIPRLPPGVSEIFAHPVLDGEELRAYYAKHADIRADDADCLTDRTVADLLDQHNLKRISPP